MIKNKTYLLTAIGLVTMLLSGQAFSFTASGTMNINATIIPSCTIGLSNVAFGNIVNNTFTLQNFNVIINCSSGTNYNVGINAGLHNGGSTFLRHMQDSTGASSIFYSIKHTNADWGDTGFGNTFTGSPVAGTGSGVNQTITGTMMALPNNGNSNVTLLNTVHSDIVTVTVNY
ncbi:spore coat protein U domain-containing protein [Mariprofundus ferrooxydans]|nr:spore coat protein U domain-containing protein [Mariprofundus ferrooxydans]